MHLWLRQSVQTQCKNFDKKLFMLYKTNIKQTE